MATRYPRAMGDAEAPRADAVTTHGGPYRSATFVEPKRTAHRKVVLTALVAVGAIVGASAALVVRARSAHLHRRSTATRPRGHAPLAVRTSMPKSVTNVTGLITRDRDLCVMVAGYDTLYCDAMNLHPPDARDDGRRVLVPTQLPSAVSQLVRASDGELFTLDLDGVLQGFTTRPVHLTPFVVRADSFGYPAQWELSHDAVRWLDHGGAWHELEGLPPAQTLVGTPHALCALTRRGEASCWSSRPPTTPRSVRGVEGASQLVVLDTVACALSYAELQCWDLPREGDTEQLTARTIPSTPIRKIVGNRERLCAIGWDDTVRCDVVGRIADAPQPWSGVEIPSLAGATELALREGGVCGLMPDRHLRCVGERLDALLDGSLRRRARFAEVVGLPRVQQIAAANQTACALSDDREVLCWGADSGRVLSPSGADRTTPSPVHALRGSMLLGVGDEVVCGLGQDRCVSCVGGVAGRTEPIRHCPNRLERADGPFRTMAVSGETVCAQHERGRVRCRRFEHPSGSTAWVDVGVAALRGLTAVADGFCALHSNDAAVCWSLDGEGHVVLEPPPVQEVASFIVHGETRRCAQRHDHRIQCWANGALQPSGDELQVPQDATQVVATTFGFAFIRSDGHATWIGQDHDIPELQGVRELAAGANFLCARHDDGSVSCAGSNARGQLGAGTPSPDAPQDAVVVAY